MALEFREIVPADRPAFQERVADLERGVTYPLGGDRFEIDHGQDYFAFFDRLGEVRYLAALEGEEVVAVVAAVLRSVPLARGEPRQSAWYFCDLKVRPDERRRRIPARLLAWAQPRLEAECPRAYAISMNPGDGGANHVVRLLESLPGARLATAATLELHSLDAHRTRELLPELVRTRGPLSFLSLRGKKDIVLQSTGSAMPLLHLQFGPCAERGHGQPAQGHAHMFCTPVEDPLADGLRGMGLAPSATATLMQRGMPGCDWSFVLTSDI